jgi:hypothetical protein
MVNFCRNFPVDVITAANVGSTVGWDEGVADGRSEGTADGEVDGIAVLVGAGLGRVEGTIDSVGCVEGIIDFVGKKDGLVLKDGANEGTVVTAGVLVEGWGVGDAVTIGGPLGVPGEGAIVGSGSRNTDGDIEGTCAPAMGRAPIIAKSVNSNTGGKKEPILRRFNVLITRLQSIVVSDRHLFFESIL